MNNSTLFKNAHKMTKIEKYREVRKLAKEKGLIYRLSDSDNNDIGFQELLRISGNTVIKDNLNDDAAFNYLLDLKG